MVSISFLTSGGGRLCKTASKGNMIWVGILESLKTRITWKSSCLVKVPEVLVPPVPGVFCGQFDLKY
jgi:hypothetical protein